jgi:hypothetical protein
VHCPAPHLPVHHRPTRAALQVDGALKTAKSVSEVLELTLPVLLPETLDSPPRPLGKLPPRLQHFAEELPPTPEALLQGNPAVSEGGSPASVQQQAEQRQEEASEVAVA